VYNVNKRGDFLDEVRLDARLAGARVESIVMYNDNGFSIEYPVTHSAELGTVVLERPIALVLMPFSPLSIRLKWSPQSGPAIDERSLNSAGVSITLIYGNVSLLARRAAMKLEHRDTARAGGRAWSVKYSDGLAKTLEL